MISVDAQHTECLPLTTNLFSAPSGRRLCPCELDPALLAIQAYVRVVGFRVFLTGSGSRKLNQYSVSVSYIEMDHTAQR